MKLDWSKIDNEKTFQNLVNHLFFLECSSSFGFIPFSPYIGKDGGWDGKFEGFYPKENLSGKFCIQSKYTKHNLNDSMPSLKKWTQDELEKAKKNNVDHLRLATSADLREEHITELEGLNNNRVKTFKVWHGHDLLLRSEKEPFIRSYYFGSPALPLFVPPSIYFDEVEKNLIEPSINLNEIKTIQLKFDEFESFLKNEKLKIFVIHAPGGYGKSHFLRGLSNKANILNGGREVWFIKDGLRDFKEAFSDEIAVRESALKKHKYIFILDDADRATDLKEILTVVMKSGIDAKLVLGLRTAGVPALDEMLDFSGCRSLSFITTISQWSGEELKALLRFVAQKASVTNEDDIVRRYPNPFFIVRIGLNIRGVNSYDFKSTQNAILQSLLNDSRQLLANENIDVKELLLHLSLITPINISDRSTVSKLAQKSNVDEHRMKKILEKLNTGGVLRSIGQILRFIPDMIGDVYLLDTMQSLSEEGRKEAFLYWLDTHQKNIFCNLGATLGYGNKECLVPIATDVVTGWISNADKYDSYEKRRVLENLEEIYHLVPKKALDALWVFLAQPDMSTDGYGPVLVRLIHSDCDRAEIVKIIETMREKVQQGTYDNYKPNTLVRETVSPLKNDIEKQIIPVLAIVQKSLSSSTPLVHFAKAAVEEVLASAHEWSRSSYKSMEFGSRSLRATESVLKMRGLAINIAKEMLMDSRSQIRLAATEIVNHIGKSRMGLGGQEVELKDQIVKERQEMMSFIEANDLIGKEKDWKVLSSYEDLLFSWWAHQEVPDEKVLKMLDKFSYGPEYRIYRYYASRWDIDEDVREKIKQAPSEDRWKWAVENVMQRKWTATINQYKNDAVLLDKKFPTPESIVTFLENLGKEVTVSSANAMFLRAWFEAHPENFKQIRLNKGLWTRVPQVFKYTITYDLVQKFEDMGKVIIEETLLVDNISIEEAKIAIDILSHDLPSINKFAVIKSVAEKNIDDLNLTILQRMRFLGDKISAKELAEIVSVVLVHMSPAAKANAIDDVGFILHGKKQDYTNEFLKGTRDILYSTLVTDGKLDYHDFEVASLMFPDIKSLIEFLSQRLQKEKDIDKYSDYEAVPFEGIGFLNKVINTSDDYLFALKSVLEWDDLYEGITNFSVEKIFEQLVSLKDAAGSLYLNSVKDKFNNGNDFQKLLNALSHLPLNRFNLDIFNEAIQNSEIFNYQDQMCDVLRMKTHPEGGWSSSPGEVPPAFIERKEIFEELEKHAPAGKLKNAVGECIKSVISMIDDHKKEEENRYHAR